MNTSSDAADIDRSRIMLDEKNYQTDFDSNSETPPASIEGTLSEPSEPELETFEFEVCTPYQGKPPPYADPREERVEIIGPYPDDYPSYSLLAQRPSPLNIWRSPSMKTLRTRTYAPQQRVIKKSRSFDATWEDRDEGNKSALNQTRSVPCDGYTVPYVSTCGVDGDFLDLTVKENSSPKSGVGQSLCFAALLELGGTKDKAFVSSTTVGSKSRREFPFKLWTSPKTWELTYDGITKLGRLEFHPSSSLPGASEENKMIQRRTETDFQSSRKPINDRVIMNSFIFCLLILYCGLIVASIRSEGQLALFWW
ncbi:hypothetical protein PCASD_19704 [Puccinia coronata f. sp. avenae]|uniref:Uncharacterized protein n=1 Tax=Puccinia coronata f. sp. avenae TaxID=200324 RepID=A0A2N5SKW6_9BASI|nr:hypothetical protein PCASD_19704 [Puccinia coronata f. sp. avenae]